MLELGAIFFALCSSEKLVRDVLRRLEQGSFLDHLVYQRCLCLRIRYTVSALSLHFPDFPLQLALHTVPLLLIFPFPRNWTWGD